MRENYGKILQIFIFSFNFFSFISTYVYIPNASSLLFAWKAWMKILIYEPISLQTTFSLHWSQLVFIFIFFVDVKNKYKSFFFILLFSAIFLSFFYFIFCCLQARTEVFKKNDFAFCLSTLRDFLSFSHIYLYNFIDTLQRINSSKYILFPFPSSFFVKKIKLKLSSR